MRLIPYKVRDQALWEFDKFEGKPDVLRKWIKDRTQWFTKADAGKTTFVSLSKLLPDAVCETRDLTLLGSDLSALLDKFWFWL